MNRTYHSPSFEDLPRSIHPDFRWVSFSLMDKEQYVSEGWEMTTIGPHDYWRASSQGMEEYTALREMRRNQRKAAWQNRQESDEEWSRHVEAMVESTP